MITRGMITDEGGGLHGWSYAARPLYPIVARSTRRPLSRNKSKASHKTDLAPAQNSARCYWSLTPPARPSVSAELHPPLPLHSNTATTTTTIYHANYRLPYYSALRSSNPQIPPPASSVLHPPLPLHYYYYYLPCKLQTSILLCT